MRHSFSLSAIFVLAASAAGGACGGDDSSSSEPASPFTIVEPSSETQEVFDEIDGYGSWGQFAATTSRPQSEGHMNMYVESYYNDVAGAAMEAGTLPLPDGAILVKEAYEDTSAASPMALTIMSKREGSWYWAQVTPDGQLFAMDGMPLEGREVSMCIGCHQDAAAENDLVATPFP